MSRGCRPVERLLFDGQVCVDVDLGGLGVLVAEPERLTVVSTPAWRSATEGVFETDGFALGDDDVGVVEEPV